MNGGGIEGWMRGTDLLDNTLGTIYRTIGSGVTFQLLGNSFVGQNITASNGGIDTGRFPNPNGQLTGASGARGVILEILGGFSGAGKLTKQGFDTVIISGASSHAGGTSVTQGTLRIGAADVLPTTGTLSTSITGVFDLNGFAQTVGTLTSNNANTPGATSGFIINSATNTVNLTVGNGSTANMVYNGQIQDNLALVKMGTGVLTLTNANTYIGGTTVNAGVLDVSNTLAGGSATGIAPVTIAGGTLAGAGAISSQVVLNSGNIKTGSYVAGVNQPGILSVGGLTINGGALNFKLDAPTSLTDDMIRITAKDLSASVKSLQLNAALTSINITALAGFKVGTYTLIDYSAAGATLGGSFSTTFTGLGVLYPTAPSPKYFLTVQNNTVGSSIDLLVQANTSAVWSGLGDGKWNTATGAIPANWANLAGSPTDYTDGFDTVFNDTATNTAEPQRYRQAALHDLQRHQELHARRGCAGRRIPDHGQHDRCLHGHHDLGQQGPHLDHRHDGWPHARDGADGRGARTEYDHRQRRQRHAGHADGERHCQRHGEQPRRHDEAHADQARHGYADHQYV
jgi:autotransporter-associated beta strand protein